jgi:hypothetical protein
MSSKFFSKLFVTSFRLASLLNVAPIIFLFLQICRRYPVNHVSYNPRWFWIVTIVTTGFLQRFNRDKSKWRYAAAGTWILLVLLLVAIDVFNILVEYETWGMRGLPGWGSVSGSDR